MIYVNDKKAVLCKGDFRPAQFYKGDKKIAGYGKETFEGEGTITLENCYNDKLYGAKLTGNCVQDATPSPEAPVEIKTVGNLVTSGEYSGKYKIGIVAYNENEEEYFDIYLDAPLCKIGEYEDYIDFENKKVIRKTSIKTFTGTEGWYRQDYRLYTECGKATGIKSSEINCISNRFESYSWEVLYRNSYLATKKIGVALQGGSYLCVTPAQEIPTVAEWKAQLSAWNDEGVPLTVVYVDATREEAIDLPTLPTFRGTTNYEIETGITAGLSGEYKKRGDRK
ncbi:MAG: hypothetical protein IJD91_05495 [Clostridia bacterium]|nr:hypothetical protein [Clostridia bacterium]